MFYFSNWQHPSSLKNHTISKAPQPSRQKNLALAVESIGCQENQLWTYQKMAIERK